MNIVKSEDIERDFTNLTKYTMLLLSIIQELSDTPEEKLTKSELMNILQMVISIVNDARYVVLKAYANINADTQDLLDVLRKNEMEEVKKSAVTEGKIIKLKRWRVDG